MDNPTSTEQGNTTNLSSPAAFSKHKDAPLFRLQANEQASDKTVAQVEGLLLAILTRISTDSMLEAMYLLWNNMMVDEDEPGMHVPGFTDWVRELPSWGIDGPIQLAHSIVCNFDYWVSLRGSGGGGSQTKLNCTESLCALDGVDCKDDVFTDVSQRSVDAEIWKRARDPYYVDLGTGSSFTISLAPVSPNHYFPLERRGVY